ncbi:hypothetical protein B0H21DRAFT_781358 [Amylocystis lapponica]|nr:hypothetical protein B0H21DRAFT_781358 [Amylocystis lapponica]
MDSANGDQDVQRVWSLLTEVSEQLSQNRGLSVSLHSLAGGIKSQAIHSQTGFVLRRFNLDKPKDAYDAELERMNTAMSAENQTLQNDNRQLMALIREYEQTLENVMTSFRTRAHEVQQRELALMRTYESAIIQRETEALSTALSASDARSASLARAGRLLRAVMRKLGGEDVQVCEELVAAEASGAALKQPVLEAQQDDKGEGRSPSQNEETESGKGETGDADQYTQLEAELVEDEDPDRRLAAAEWALERESELARLERENQELRSLLGGVMKASSSEPSSGSAAQRTGASGAQGGNMGAQRDAGHTDRASSSWQPPQFRQLGGLPGTVGPFGTFKRPQPRSLG